MDLQASGRGDRGHVRSEVPPLPSSSHPAPDRLVSAQAGTSGCPTGRGSSQRQDEEAVREQSESGKKRGALP